MTEGREWIAEFGPQRFRRYPDYRDSGVEWLGEIPAHWEVQKLSWLTKCLDGRRVPLNAEERGRMQGDYPYWGANSIVDHVDQWLFDEELILLGEDGAPFFDRSRPVAFRVAGKIWVNNHAHVLRPRAEMDAAFLAGTLNCVDYRAFIDGSTRDKLTQGDMKAIPIQCPPVQEQGAIAEFLDRETAKIDALVAKKERLIELLQEKRSALITRAVTRGLDPSVPMKDSGVKWLGEIPAHWEVKRLWHLTPRDRKIMYGIVLPGPNVDVGVPIVKGGDVATRLKQDALNRTSFEIESRYVRSRLRGGDLVYAIRGSIGEVEVVPDELEGANLTQDAARVAYTKATHGHWLLYALRSKGVFGQLEAGALGATIKGINIRDLKRARIPVPPRSEQPEIASFLTAEARKFEGLSSMMRSAINHLKEYRTALISAAVTGKIDVRNEAA